MRAVEPVVIRWRPYFDDDVSPAHLVRTRARGGLVAGIVLLVLAGVVLGYALSESFDAQSAVIVIVFALLGVGGVLTSTLTLRSIQSKPTNSGTVAEPAFTVDEEQVSFPDGDRWPVAQTRWTMTFGVLILRREGVPPRRFQVVQLQRPLAEVTAALEQVGVQAS